MTVTLERDVPGRDDRPGIVVDATGDHLVEIAKRIPRGDRYWTGAGWWVAARHETAIVPALVARFGAVTVLDDEGKPLELVELRVRPARAPQPRWGRRLANAARALAGR